MSDKKPDDPTPTLKALHVSLGGRKTVQVKPNGGLVSIGDKTWSLDASCLAPGEGKWDIILIEGKGRAVSFNADLDNPSPEEWDQATHNNLLKQIHDLSQPAKTPAVSWIMIGMLGLVILVAIGAGIKSANDVADLKKELVHFELQMGQTPGSGADTTTIQGHPSASSGAVQH